jgi:TDG/mug DNA glycosylase family protein
MRPSKGINDITKHEIMESIPILLEKIETFRPHCVLFIGGATYEPVRKCLKRIKKGWGEQEILGASRCFVVPNTSGLVRMKYEEQLSIWIQLNSLINSLNS